VTAWIQTGDVNGQPAAELRLAQQCGRQRQALLDPQAQSPYDAAEDFVFATSSGGAGAELRDQHVAQRAVVTLERGRRVAAPAAPLSNLTALNALPPVIGELA